MRAKVDLTARYALRLASLSLTLESLIRVVLTHSGFGFQPRLSGTIPWPERARAPCESKAHPAYHLTFFP